MTTPPLFRIGLLILALCLTSHSATLARFDFNNGSLVHSATPITGFTVSAIETDSEFNSFTSQTSWDSAAQISGADSFFSNPTSHLAAKNAVYFTIAAAQGYRFTLENFSFLARSTSQAPADIGFKMGERFFDLSDAYSNNSTITTLASSLFGFTNLSFLTISIQGWNSTGASPLQLDRIQLTGTVIPELSVACLGGLASLLILRRRR